MNDDLKDYMSACSICRCHETSQQRYTLMHHGVPGRDRPWAIEQLLGSRQLDNTNSVTVLKKMKTHFARYGIPDQVVNDNGPQYTSHHFANFSRTWDFKHITSSPGHSQSNGMRSRR